MKPSWECVRHGLMLARLDHDGVNYEPTQREIGDTLLSIIRTMSPLAIAVMFDDLMHKHKMKFRAASDLTI